MNHPFFCDTVYVNRRNTVLMRDFHTFFGIRSLLRRTSFQPNISTSHSCVEHLKTRVLPCCESMSERNGCCLIVVLECFGYFWSCLIVKAVDDNKNNLTYFVRVDWHLPERELTKKSEANLFFEHLKKRLLPCCEFLSMSERNVCYLIVVLECFGVVWL